MLTRPHTGASWFLLPALLFLSVASASELPAAEGDSQLLETSWVPGSENRYQVIEALLLTRKGYLWIGSNKGLIRFDGVRFTDFPFATTPGMCKAQTNFNAMWEDAQGGVWAGTEGGVTHYDGIRFSSLTTRDGLPSNSVLRIDGDASGAVWIFTTKGVCRWDKGALQLIRPEEDGDRGSLVSGTPNIEFDMARVGLWRLSSHNHLQRFAYGHWSDFPIPPGNIADGRVLIRSIYEDSLHRVWYSPLSAPGRYFQVSPENALVEYQGVPTNAHVFFCDQEGFLWLTDHQANTARWKNGRLYPLDSLKTPYLTHMIQTADGGLWAGTLFSKLFLFRSRLIAKIPILQTPEIGPRLFQQKNGLIWAAATDIVRFANGKRKTVASLGNEFRHWGITYAIGEDRYGTLLLADGARSGVVTLQGNKVVPAPRYSSITGKVRAILLDSAGDEWFGTTTGLLRFSEGRVKSISGLDNFNVCCLLESAQPGHFWVGTDKGLVQVSDGKVAALPEVLHWPHGTITSLSQDRQHSLWLSTLSNGIVHFVNGNFQVLNESSGLPTSTIYSIDASGDRYLWLRTDSGLLRIDKESLSTKSAQQKPELKIVQFDETDGLLSYSMQPAGDRGSLHLPDGTIWFSLLGGVASVPPNVMQNLPSQTHAVIEEHVVDSSTLHSSEPSGITVRPGESNLAIRYTALGAYHPEQVQFRYQLSGIDNDWVYVGSRRTAFYSHLPPGNYIFYLQAADAATRDWKEPAAQIPVRVLAPFYQTWWMKLLLFLTSLAMVALVIESRRRRMLEADRLRQAFTHRLIASQESERQRIAAELHDSLGQRLLVIKNLALFWLQGESGDARGRERVEEISNQASEATREVRDIAYDLRPYQLDRIGLTKAVESLVRTIKSASAIHTNAEICNIDDVFPKELQVNFYRIVQEALNNVLKHAQATEVSVSVHRASNKIVLVVEDNGKGGVPTRAESPAPGGFGLTGMVERGESLGGKTTIQSRAGQGTTVTLEIPLS